MTVALDGTVVTNGSTLVSVVSTPALSATTATGVVVCDIFLETINKTYVNTVAGSGLIFTRKSQSITPWTWGGSSGFTGIERWWAATTSAFTSTLSVSLNASGEIINVVAYALKGAGTPSYPWDSNSAFPYVTGVTVAGTGITYLTNNPQDFVIVVLQTPTNTYPNTISNAGWTSLASLQTELGGYGFDSTQIWYKNITQTTTETLTWVGGVPVATATVDAVTVSAAGTPPPYVPGMSSIG